MILTESIVKETFSKHYIILIPNEYTEIGDYAFKDCNATQIIINRNITKIGKYAFQNCFNLGSNILANITNIPNNVEYIGEYAFQNCKNLKQILIGSKIETLNVGLFENCINLEYVFKRGNIKEVKEKIFNKCFNFIKIEFINEDDSINLKIDKDIILKLNNEIVRSKNFDSRTSTCDIYNLIESVSGIKSTSTSNTDTWIINFKTANPTFYENIIIDKAFLKISLKDYIYEIKIYEKIMLLYNNNICTNFVKYLGNCVGATYKQLLNILMNKLKFNVLSTEYLSIPEHLYKKMVIELLRRNLYYIHTGKRDRPAINDYDNKSVNIENTFGKLYIDLDSKSLSYNILLLEYIENSFTLFKWIKKNRESENFKEEFWNILFQICIACYSMSLSKIIHNDLHSNNIFIKEFKTEVVSLYYINNIKTIIKSKYKPLIYDFDRSYSVQLDKNIHIEKEEYLKFSLSNKYIENKDIIKIFCYIYSLVEDSYKNIIISLVSKNIDGENMIKKVYKNDKIINDKRYKCFLQYLDADNKIFPIPDSFYENFNSCEEIIEKINKNLPILLINENKINENNIFYCNKTYFSSDGYINIDKIEKDRSKIYEPVMKKFKEIDYGYLNTKNKRLQSRKYKRTKSKKYKKTKSRQYKRTKSRKYKRTKSRKYKRTKSRQYKRTKSRK